MRDRVIESEDLARTCGGREVLAFPGQGIDVEALRATLTRGAGDPLVERLRDEAEVVSWYDVDFNSTTVAQPAVFVAGVLNSRRLDGRKTGLVVGHSLGEWTALTVAGAFKPLDGLRLVQARAAASSAASRLRPGEMMAVMGLDIEEVEWTRRMAIFREGGSLEVAGYNGRGQVVLSGDCATVAAAFDLVAKAEGLAQRLNIGGAFHSSLMAPAVTELAEALPVVKIHRPRCPWLSTIDLRCHDDPSEIRRLLLRALVLPVRWLPALEMIAGAEPTMLIDVGPGETLRKLARRSKLNLRISAIQDIDSELAGETCP